MLEFLKILFFIGTALQYASRYCVPLCLPMISKELNWDKLEMSGVLSSFMWGYTLTQVFGGMLSDRIGGHKVVIGATFLWSTLLFFTKSIVYNSGLYSYQLFVFQRFLFGVCQGVYFPATSSFVGSTISLRQRTVFSGYAFSGSYFGNLFVGLFGSLMLNKFGWPFLFYNVSLLGFAWSCFVHFYLKHRLTDAYIQKNEPLAISFQDEKKSQRREKLTICHVLFRREILILILTQMCEVSAFYMVSSWMPTYFEDVFPGSHNYVYNILPYIFCIPAAIGASHTSQRFLETGKYTVTRVRKLCVTVAYLPFGISLILIHLFQAYFYVTVFLFVIALTTKACNNAGTGMIPNDLSPEHSGLIFGIMNCGGAVASTFAVQISGFVLKKYNDWMLVFAPCGGILILGLFLFTSFGSCKRIR